ncbi:MAG: ATP synthase F1 subunit epsilon [Flavobacteriales bacterium]
MKLNVISPDRTLYEGEVEKVQLPGKDGRFGILKGHAPLIAALKAGKLDLTDDQGNPEEFEIKGGVVEVKKDLVMVLAEE